MTARKFLLRSHISAKSQAACEAAFAELGGIYVSDTSHEESRSGAE